MRISSNYTFTPKTVKPSFGSTDRYYKTPEGKEIGNNTWVFRDDLDWKKVTQFEIGHFKKKKKVNIIQFAASDGSEGYTKIISLLENRNRHKVDKFFPIMAYDIDDHIMSKAQSGYLGISQKDLERFKTHCVEFSKYFTRKKEYTDPNGKYYRYIQSHPDMLLSPLEPFKVSDILTNKIKFELGDMFKILPTIKDDSNTILMCRNILGYFDNHIIQNFIEEAGKVLKTGSLFEVGFLEATTHNFEKMMNRNSFMKIMKNVFMKV